MIPGTKNKTLKKYIIILQLSLVIIACEKIDNKQNITACFDYSPKANVKVGDTLTFLNCSEYSTNFDWDFGDGNYSTEKDPKHVYEKIGSYMVRIVAKNENSIDSIAKIIDVISKTVLTKYDTIYPLPYFPAYPGSFWVFSNGDTLRIEDNYELFYYNKSDWSAPPIYDTIYLAKFRPNSIYFNGNPQEAPYIYVYGYTISTVTYRLPFKTILSEDINVVFQTAEYFGGNAGYGKTIKSDTTITINNVKYENVIIVINYSWNQNMGDLPWSTKDYYAKNIGLIKRESRSDLNTTSISLVFELESYKINK